MLSLFKAGMFNARAVMPTYCGYKEMLDKLNKFLKKKPIPGSSHLISLIHILRNLALMHVHQVYTQINPLHAGKFVVC
ncbi:hypothetical protein DPMN_148277 [Dreissena polymorpha]|uniref:Uncharacterized protein n=1 Tax=Dreissena polymorpha TaxID=45954 RepID=A0A9D4F996_DREPO|nr:hypothetical protein DPMN_148277 [Dreissena polymorpha]